MDENEEFEFRHRAEQEAAQSAVAPAAPSAAAPAQPGFLDRAGQALDKVPGVGLIAQGTAGAINLAGKAVAGLAGLASGGDENVVNNVRDTLSVPVPATNDPLVKMLGSAHSAIEQSAPVQAAGNTVENAPPGVREALEGSIEAIPDIAGVLGAKASLEGATARTAAKVEGAAKPTPDDPVATMRAAGIKLRPTDVKALKPGEKVPGTFRESLKEPAELKKDFTLDNQATVTKLAAEDLGAPNSSRLMKGDFDKLKQPHFDKYDEVNAALEKTTPPKEYTDAVDEARAAAGFDAKDKATVTQVISQLRKDARKNQAAKDITTQKAGDASERAADKLEDTVAGRLEALGEDKLHGDYQASRKSLAKINDYEQATRGGQVDPAVLRKLDKKAPGRLTGNAKLIADANDAAPNVVRHSRSATGAGSSVKADSVMGAIKNVGGKLISKLPGMDIARPGFQNKFGREATPQERSGFKDYGKRPERVAPVSGQKPSQMGASGVDFTRSPEVPPVAGKYRGRDISTLADELELSPEPVQGAQQLPAAPDRLTADIVPPVRGDIPFTASSADMPSTASLAGDLGLARSPASGPTFYRGRKSAGPIKSDTPYFAHDEDSARAYATEFHDGGTVTKAQLRMGKTATAKDVERVAAANGIDLIDGGYPAAYLDQSPDLVAALKREGFDSATGRDALPEDRGAIDSTVVFSPDQVTNLDDMLDFTKAPDVSAAPNYSTLNDLLDQLGLNVDTQQRTATLQPPPGRVGKAKKRGKG